MPKPALIPDPRLIPVVGTGADLPRVEPSQLEPAALRDRLSGCASWQPESPGDGRVLPDRSPRPAAVLIGLIERAQGLTVLLTRRTEQLRDHAGQISFPGGRSDPQDRDAVATALREAREEIGLDPARVEVIGQLPIYTTITAYQVTPVVAFVLPPRQGWQIDPGEVAEVFEVPLSFLMNPGNHQVHRFEDPGGTTRNFLSMPWQQYFVWGATAGMLRNLYRGLRG
jgi:8-oxo-dGTP pyrophosphatase MutT (NUDIX family)